MATITSELQGRLLTLVNRTGYAVGVAGKVLPAGGTLQVRLADVQNQKRVVEMGVEIHLDPRYMDELQSLVDSEKISIAVESDVKIDGTAAQELDAPLDAQLQAAREVWNNLAAADADGIKTAFTAPAADTTYTGSDLDGAVGPGYLGPPRNITFTGTCGVGEDLDGGTAVIVGEDIDGQLRSESVTLSVVAASATATDEGAIAFRRVDSILIPADASGSPGDYEIGFGNKIGFSRPMQQGFPVAEFEDNAVATPGTVVLSGTSAPNGTYAPNTDPNGVHDYILVYVPA